MQRRKALQRKTPLRAKKALERSGQLARKARLRSKPKEKISDRERVAMAAWGQADRSARCVVCGKTKREAWRSLTKLEAHHAISKQKIKQVAVSRGLDLVTVLWDLRNRVWVCGEPCHRRHTDAVQRIRRSMLPASVFEFARELALTYVIDREYPR